MRLGCGGCARPGGRGGCPGRRRSRGTKTHGRPTVLHGVVSGKKWPEVYGRRMKKKPVDLEGAPVLVAEDNPVIGIVLAAEVEDAGGVPVGPAHTVEEA